MSRSVYNFAPGPAMLPRPVMDRLRSEVLDFEGLGAAAFEISHTSPPFKRLLAETEEMLRELMAIPPDYKVIFCHGGATMQFSMVPLNLMQRRPAGRGLYVESGDFARRAIEEGGRYGPIRVVASSATERYAKVPTIPPEALDLAASYLHVTVNNTLIGTQMKEIPDTGDLPLVGDVTSEILSRSLDVRRFGVLYAGAQKNLGVSGMSVAVIREDLLGHAFPYTPNLLNWKTLADTGSLANTIHTFAVYAMHRVLEWTREQGGVAALSRVNEQKAALLYEVLDTSDFYVPLAHPEHRSMLNVSFTLADETLLPTFLNEALAEGLYALKGHKVVGGLRASIYNAMPLEGVQALAQFMTGFVRRHG